MATYVGDGYELTGYIAESAKSKSGEILWDAVEFEYRPATRAEIVRLDAQVRILANKSFDDAESSVKIDKLTTEFIAKHLSSWNVKDRGNDVPCDQNSLQRVHDEVYQKIYFIIRGHATSDKRPEESAKDPSDEELQKN